MRCLVWGLQVFADGMGSVQYDLPNDARAAADGVCSCVCVHVRVCVCVCMCACLCLYIISASSLVSVGLMSLCVRMDVKSVVCGSNISLSTPTCQSIRSLKHFLCFSADIAYTHIY